MLWLDNLSLTEELCNIIVSVVYGKECCKGMDLERRFKIQQKCFKMDKFLQDTLKSSNSGYSTKVWGIKMYHHFFWYLKPCPSGSGLRNFALDFVVFKKCKKWLVAFWFCHWNFFQIILVLIMYFSMQLFIQDLKHKSYFM